MTPNSKFQHFTYLLQNPATQVVDSPTYIRSDPMSNDQPGRKELIEKAAGYLAISGIAISIIKSITPFQKPKPIFKNNEINEPIQLIQQFNCVSLPEPIIEKPIASFDEKDAELSMEKKVDVVKGDTLLSLSHKYGVSVEAIKEANELIGYTIYPGKKFVRSSKCNWSC